MENIAVRLEAEAKLHIQHQIFLGDLELAWSYMMDYENSLNPFSEKRDAIARWKFMAVVDIGDSEGNVESAKKIALKGIKKKDSLHPASAIEAGCHYFLTTDKKIFNKTFEQIRAMNPLDFIRQQGESIHATGHNHKK
ncbi:MAG: hypothetical protein FWH27_07125 [Planctomycetaceae bacterium]|nr:hypothetical protein [Planctomycetaceae bacterium]